MIIAPECKDCIINRTKGILQRSAINQERYTKILKLVGQEIDYVILEGESWTSDKLAPAQLGTVRQEILGKFRLNNTYEREREVGKKIGKRIYNHYSAKNLDLQDLIKIVTLANGLEFDIGGKYKSINPSSYKQLIDQSKRIVGQTDLIVDEINNMVPKNLLYILDNVGEHYCDALLIKWFENKGWNVTVVVKGAPVLNDVTMEEMEDYPFEGNILTTGNDDVGIFLSRVPEKLFNAIKNSDLIIIKGMANFETLSRERLTSTALYLLKAKCEPVAKLLKIQKDEYFTSMVQKNLRLFDIISQY